MFLKEKKREKITGPPRMYTHYLTPCYMLRTLAVLGSLSWPLEFLHRLPSTDRVRAPGQWVHVRLLTLPPPSHPTDLSLVGKHSSVSRKCNLDFSFRLSRSFLQIRPVVNTITASDISRSGGIIGVSRPWSSGPATYFHRYPVHPLRHPRRAIHK